MKILLESIALFACVFLSHVLNAQIKVDDFYHQKDGKDWSKAINKAMVKLDSIGHGSLEFTGTRNYTIDAPLELPKYHKSGKRLIVLNGNGCSIIASDTFMVFHRIPSNQKEALDKYMSTRFVFNDFNFIGGKVAIDLGASYSSSINRCNFQNQTLSAIDIQFGLNTSIEQCNSIGGAKYHFVLRCGEAWGGNGVNSQSNHSVIEKCRVYAGKDTKICYKVVGSSGCVIRDCISEGQHTPDYSIYFDYQKSTTVRLFKVENLHLEHTPQKAGIYVRNTGVATIDGVFYQTAKEEYPLVYAASRCDQISLLNVPHYVGGTVLFQEGGNDGACWSLENCSKEFYDAANWRIVFKDEVKKKLPYYFRGKGYRYQIGKSFNGGK